MKIYFACSIKGEKGGQKEKNQIVRVIKDLGHSVLTEIFPTEEIHARGDQLGPELIYNEDMTWINESDVLVADVTRLSLGVGYEIGWSIAKRKKVVALCQKNRIGDLSFMIKGNTERNFHLYVWNKEQDLRSILEKELGDAKHQSH